MGIANYSLRNKRPRYEADRSLLSIAENKNEGICASVPRAYEVGLKNNGIYSFKLFFLSSVNNRGTNFGETRFIFKSSVNIRWHELQDKPVT